MAASINTKSSMNLKLLIDSRSQRVLFAEAGKDFVDFLFALMSLPVGTVINLLSSNAMVGSLGKLYQSIDNLNDTCMQPNVDKEALLHPKAPALYGANPIPFLLPNNNIGHGPAGKNMYVCSQISHMPSSGTSLGGSNLFAVSSSSFSFSSSPSSFSSSSYASGHRYVTDDSTAICPQCKNRMSMAVNYVVGGKKVAENKLYSTSSSGSEEGGFVKGVITYMVMDDLEVSQMSTISSITLLNKFNVKAVGGLQEKMVPIGMNEGLKLLKASFQSKTVLTDVFLGKKSS